MSESKSRQSVLVWRSRPDRPAASIRVEWFGSETGYIPVHLVDTVKILSNGSLMTWDCEAWSPHAKQLFFSVLDTIMASEQIASPFGGSSDE